MPAGQGRDDLVVTGVITASEPSWIGPFAGLSPRQFSRLITALRRREGADPVRKGRPWSLPWGGAAGGRVLAHQPHPVPARSAVQDIQVGSRPDRRPSRTGSRPAAAATVVRNHRAHRGRHPGYDPRPDRGRIQ